MLGYQRILMISMNPGKSIPATAMPTPAITAAPILPGAWLGMVGGGQLGRMFCFAAQAMGYRVAVLDPDAVSPAGRVADRHLCAAYDDNAALAELAQLCAAVSTEFENVPAASLERLAQDTFVRPAAHCVSVAQDRIAEKRFIEAAGVPVAPHRVIESAQALAALNDETLAAVLPGILKTARLGYDGKGQVRVDNAQEARDAYAKLGGVPCVLEKRLPLKFEISALVARGATGETAVYPIAQNTHHNGVLALTLVPAPAANAALVQQAQQAALNIAAALDYVGVLCVEFFILEDGSLVANEMAPRPHNSGHYTMDACAVSQFEQQVRAMAALPLGTTHQHSPAAMLNVLGDAWFAADAQGHQPADAHTPPWHRIVALPAAHLHLYGKQQARAGRKMGHITCTAATLDEAHDAARECAAILQIAM
jgi:5-(carboxyamino)imidazole ribonucleotide synthase